MNKELDLSAEQIVTNLLSKNDVLINNKKSSIPFSANLNLSEYLTKLPNENVEDFVQETSAQNVRYTFIKGKWIF